MDVRPRGHFAEVGGADEVYLYSITAVVVRGAFARAFGFIHYCGVRMKAQDRSFFYTTGHSIDSEGLTESEDETDCIIQLELYDPTGVIRGRLKAESEPAD